MQIAILLANNDDSPFSLRFPNDGDKIAALLKDIRPQWTCTIWSVKDQIFPSFHDADGYIITGSPVSVHDSLPWINPLSAAIEAMVRAGTPLVGLCFGHQLVAKALGGAVERSPSGWRFGAANTTFVTPRDWMTPLHGALRLFASHSEQVTRLPVGASLWGSAPNCPYASFTIGSTVMTTQYHPEFSRHFMRALALEYRGELPEDVLRTGTVELELGTDGAIFFQWMARFLESGGEAAIRKPMERPPS